jgi:SAM-dependent methyltransferase
MIAKTVNKTINAIVRQSVGRLKELTGAKPQFEIRGGYRHRNAYLHYDDSEVEDEYQREVYIRAAELMEREHLKTIYDVGCGSGYKLLHYLGKYDTKGFDVPETLDFLRRTHPDRKWESAPLSDRSHAPADLVICADVIEHVLDPDELMKFIVSHAYKWLIISTPDRSRLYLPISGYQFGPPNNPHHIREWAFEEFYRFVGRYVDVKEHVISNHQQATQMVVARTPVARGRV